MNNAPGAGNSRTFTVYLDGAPTAMAVTVSDADTTGSTTGSIAVTPFSQIALLHTDASGPVSSRVFATIIIE